MPGKNEDTDTRHQAQWLAFLKLSTAFGLVIGGLVFWWGTPPPGTFEGLVLMALATLVGTSR